MVDMLERWKDIYGRYPLKIALVGGFTSKDNLHTAKKQKIKLRVTEGQNTAGSHYFMYNLCKR